MHDRSVVLAVDDDGRLRLADTEYPQLSLSGIRPSSVTATGDTFTATWPPRPYCLRPGFPRHRFALSVHGDRTEEEQNTMDIKPTKWSYDVAGYLAHLPTGELLNWLRILEHPDLDLTGRAFFWAAAEVLSCRYQKVHDAIQWWSADDRTDSVVDRIAEAIPADKAGAARLDRLHDLNPTCGELRWLAEYLADSEDMGPALDALERGRTGDPNWPLIADRGRPAMTGGLWLVLVIEPCDDGAWLHGAYDDEETAERGFANAVRTVFGPDWETWLDIDDHPVFGPAGEVPAKRVIEGSFGIVELSGPYPVRTVPVEAADHLEATEWYERLAKHGRRRSVPGTWRSRLNNPELPSPDELRVYLAHLPTSDLLARVREIEECGREETADQFEVRTLAAEVLSARRRTGAEETRR